MDPSEHHHDSGGEEDDRETSFHTEMEDKKKKPRKVCLDGCRRPSSVCICPFLPASPIPTSTRIVVVHHPHELRRNRLATLPALSRSLLHLHPIPGRRLVSFPSTLLSPNSTPLLLFPAPNSTPLPLWVARNPPALRRDLVLVVLDGTWAQAKEMAAASMPFLSAIGVVPVALMVEEGIEGESTFESDLVLRKEPFKGCVSTIEAVARALRILEPEEKVGIKVEEALIRVLKAMVQFQKQHLKPMKPRPRLRKKDMKRAEKVGEV